MDKVKESKQNFSSRLNKTVQLISDTAGKSFKEGNVQDVSKLMNFRASPAEMIGRKSSNNIIPAEGVSTNEGNDNHILFDSIKDNITLGTLNADSKVVDEVQTHEHSTVLK
jgi:hypothetical protein